ncbi:uncharacterized protein B0I36DRAFT_240088 [Microdochium trichocladiopsis]|uniref:Uncharacterized protein n=1 Tax=Microdochium trichocladiopsis TaxID=1682393 RepID=A0A9P8YC85_9PEZI|nr:uncharacterized protein B0I36DRAFT_240088 [Microdochium trichocladiopsis]KAH7035721.1 hypothetical protein B0I36DRAFT_240088 [Microdochium trichocladiopsis]
MAETINETRRIARLIRHPDHCPVTCAWTFETCQQAMRGRSVPDNLNCPVVRLCIVSGIRHNPGYCDELRSTNDAYFIRALNARDIMSGKIPEILDPDHVPYCIWYPEVGPEAVYRQLAQRYPPLKYNVGRACAVAGYHELYESLGLLPDLAIAEEARDNMSRNPKSKIILDAVLGQSQQWLVMDDYSRSVREQPERAHHGLNGDTAVRSTLQRRRKLEDPGIQGSPDLDDPDYDEVSIYHNITEDFNISEIESSPYDQYSQNTQITDLLWSPLPQHLPSGNKDILILMAAWYGDIDRYSRLRRAGFRLDREDSFITRGIYHNVMFAKWWTMQPAGERAPFEMAITARYIMSNDLSRVPVVPLPHAPNRLCGHLPYVIWFPDQAIHETYEELARRQPGMKPAVARACIAANLPELWALLDPEPDKGLWEEAEKSANPMFRDYLKRRCAEAGINPLVRDLPHPIGLDQAQYEHYYLSPSYFRKSQLPPCLTVKHFDWGEVPQTGRYNGYEADVSQVELFACAPESLRPPAHAKCLHVNEVYRAMKDRPPTSPLTPFVEDGIKGIREPPRPWPSWYYRGRSRRFGGPRGVRGGRIRPAGGRNI